MKILHRALGSYSGPYVHGTISLEPPMGDDAEFHAQRAYWLTCQVETANKIGGVMMADGTAFTIGLDQHIAVYPRELAAEDWNAEDDQGDAWVILARMGGVSRHMDLITKALNAKGWYIEGGRLRWLHDGQDTVRGKVLQVKARSLVHGATIREAITPNQGVVLKDTPGWETAKAWATMFHNLTADMATLKVQRAFGIEHLCNRIGNRTIQLNARRRPETILSLVYRSSEEPVPNIERISSSDMRPELDLALCVLHSHSVNAPSIAFAELKEAINDIDWNPLLRNPDNEARLAERILSRLRVREYGRWKARWDRTRKAAMGVGWWDKVLFRTVMPI